MSSKKKAKEADEIIRRLSTPYKTPAEKLDEYIIKKLSTEIAKMIDKEVLANYNKKLSTEIAKMIDKEVLANYNKKHNAYSL